LSLNVGDPGALGVPIQAELVVSSYFLSMFKRLNGILVFLLAVLQQIQRLVFVVGQLLDVPLKNHSQLWIQFRGV
jgi:hypothetical protein